MGVGKVDVSFVTNPPLLELQVYPCATPACLGYLWYFSCPEKCNAVDRGKRFFLLLQTRSFDQLLSSKNLKKILLGTDFLPRRL